MGDTTIDVEAILFDMDGTLVDSTAAVNETYVNFCRQHSFEITSHPHGIRTRDTMKKYFPKASDAEIQERTTQFEGDVVSTAKALKAAGKTGLVVLPGVRRILDTIKQHPDAEQRYAICTSATSAFAASALEASDITPPEHLLTAEDCTRGKPHPEPYLKGAEMLSKPISKCLVIEDAPSGIAAGKSAGATVLAVCTSHGRKALEGLQADFIVTDLEEVHIALKDGGGFHVNVRRSTARDP